MSRHEKRRGKLFSAASKHGADAMLVTDFTNVTYLTGFSGDDSYLLLREDDSVLLSDPRYTIQIDEECPGLSAAIRKPGVSLVALLKRILRKTRTSVVAVEASSMTIALRDSILKEIPGIELKPVSGLVESLRVTKDREEIEKTRVAVRQAESGFAVIRAALRGGQTEKQIAAELEYQIRLFGAKECAFPSIVAVGARAALPHATLSDRRVESAELLLIDWGANEGLYRSDLTRVLVTGRLSPKLEKIYRTVLEAQLTAIDAIRPGMACEDVDAVARVVIEKAGYGKYFGHGLGHGLGLHVHEGPRLGKGVKTPLKPGMIVTVEPGIYLPNWGGVRIEDDVLITRDGCEVLSNVPKELEDVVVEV
jgi:Xaa-Pro aminopeptidase